MANRKNTFLIKRSNVAGKVPAAGDLQLGELALNTADNILYASGTTANSILPIGWDRVARTGDTMTGGLFAPSISATTISATTYYNLPTDIFTTGGTYSTGTATFTNNTGGTFTVSGFNVGGGGGQVFYLNLSQSQNGNRLLSTTASTASEQTSGVTIANGVTSTIASFQSQPLNITLLPGGIWSFYLHSYKQNNNATFNIFVEVYKRTSGGTETLLFATDPTAVTTNSPNPSMQLSDGYFSGTSLNVSDSVVAVVRATNTGNQSHTITLVTEGSTHYSYVVSTIPTQQGLTCDTLSGCSIIQTIQTDISNKFDKSGGTVNGATNFTNGLSATTISATTYYNLPTDISVTGGTYSNNTFTYTNNTGGTFSTLFNTMTGLTITGNLIVTGGTQSWFSGNSSSDLVRITQIGTGNAFVVEDSVNPDTSPFVINNTGKVGIGTTTPISYLDINLNSSLLNSETLPHGIRIGLADGGIQNLLIGADASNNISYLQSLSYADFIDGQLSLNPRGGKVGIGIYDNLNAQLHIQNTTLAENSFLVEDSTNPDSSPFVINNAGNVGVGVGTPTTKLDVSGDTKISGGLTATTISATTYYNLPTDVRVTGGTYSNSTGVATFTNNTGGTFNVNGFFKPTDDIYTTGITFNNGTYDLSIGRNDGTSFSQSLAILATDMTVTGGTYNGSTGVATFTNNSGGTFSVSGFLTGMTDTYTTGVTFNNNILTIQRNAGQPDINTLINNFSGLTVNGNLSATTVSATTYYNLPDDLWTQNGSSIYYNTGNVGIGESNPTRKFEVVDGTNSAYINLTGTSGPVVVVSTTDYTKLSRFSATDGSTSILFGMRTSGETANPGFGAQNDTYIYANSNANGLNIINAAGTSKGDYIRLYAGEVANSSIAHLHVQGSGSTKGFIGINTENPIARLHVSGNTLISGGLTATTLSATTYLNLPTDISVTGGTHSSGTTTFRNNTGGTFTVSGFSTGNTTLYLYAESSTIPSVRPIVNGTNSIALGGNAEALANDMFVYGQYAGNGTTGATYSNLIGYYAGREATGATNSNFIGTNAGREANSSQYSNFIGYLAGYSSTTTSYSNFYGYYAGHTASNATYSNFFGTNAGYLANSSNYSNFIGTNAGQEATGATTSNFIGYQAGQEATDATSSNFIGNAAGYLASGSSQSNFIGLESGRQSSGNTTSNFFGNRAGYFSINNVNGNFIGVNAGHSSTGATNSNFIGSQAGYISSGSTLSNFIGNNAGRETSNSIQSNFIGTSAGYLASSSQYSNFIGHLAGYLASSSQYTNLIGYYAGQQSTGITASNFIGVQAGNTANNATYSNFNGYQAGFSANDSSYSNFFGYFAGRSTSNATYSNFIGHSAGREATTAININLIGREAGFRATGLTNSIFVGSYAGAYASNSTYSNFIGYGAGFSATSATYSNLFGFNAGETFVGNNIGSNNIIIGTNISLPNATANGINIGGVLFGTGTYSTTTGDPSIVPIANGRIGIGVVSPSERLHVSGNTLINGNLTVSGNTNVRGLTGTSATISGAGQNILTVIGSGNSTSSPLFSVQGSSGELFSVTDSLTGSLFSVNDISGLPIVEVFSDNTMLVGSYQAPALNTTVKTILTAGTNTIYSIPTSAYTGSFIDYTVISSGATGARAGTIMSIWSGTTAQYTDVSTNDIGTTAGITFSVSVVGNNAVLSSSATTAGWTLKTIIRSI